MITPATPIKQLRRMVLQTYSLQTVAVFMPAFLLWLVLNAMGSALFVALQILCAAICAVSGFGLWNSAIRARQSLLGLIEIKRQMEKL